VVGSLTDNKLFALVADPDHDPGSGIFLYGANFKSFADQLPWWMFAVSECF